MEKTKRKQLAYPSPAACFGICLLLAALLFAVCLFFTVPTWLDNDDSNIAFSLAGYFSGKPYPAHPFINPILSAPVSWLYRLLPFLPWWLIIQVAAVLVSCAAVGECISTVCRKKGLSPFFALFFYGAYTAGLCLYPLLLVTFTLTSASMGAAAIAMLLASGHRGPAFSVRRILSLAGLFFCFLFRNSSGYPMLCYYTGALCFLIALAFFDPERSKGAYTAPPSGKKKNAGPIRRLLYVLIAALIIALVCVLINRWGLIRFNADGFLDFDTARGRLLDYPADTYGQNPDLYESAGWDGDLSAMVRLWYYMDPRVTAESMETILAGSKASGPRTAGEILDSLVTFFSAYPIGCLFALLPMAFTTLGLSALFVKKRDGAEKRTVLIAFVFLLGMGLGTLSLTLYLACSGRLVLRAFQLFCLPWGASSLILSLYMLPEDSSTLQKKAALLPALALLLSLLPAGKAALTVLRYDSSAQLNESRAMIAYVQDHPDTVFIRDTHAGNNIDALTTYPKPSDKPLNLLDWGGTGALTGAREMQLELLREIFGDRIRLDTPETFFLENVCLLSDPESRDLRAFTVYIKGLYPGASVEMAETVTEHIAVYRVIRPNGQ